jgi:shikimate dehydrogenase
MISGTTKVFGILGQPVAHSLSPAMHNAAFAALRIDAVYVALPVTDLAQAVAGLRGLGIAGVSVTIPFKEAIIPLLTEVDADAHAIGAVNTVVNRDGRLWGTNTDWLGALAALQAQVDLAGRRVLVLGAGGAGRAIVYAVRRAGGQVWVTDADLDRAKTLAREFGGTAVPWTEAPQAAAAILINATPVGMAPQDDEIPYPPEQLANIQVVMDIVYKPLQTRLLREAAARGCRIIDGLEMLVYQGVRQFELFTGESAPVAVMRQAARSACQ